MYKTEPIGPLGAHTSSSGGVFNALKEGSSIGATTIQLFTANQRRWESKPLAEDSIKQFTELKQAGKWEKLMSHASYLLNLGSPDPINLKKSRDAFAREIERCLLLGINYVNFHPGSALDAPREACMDSIIDSLEAVAPLLQGSELVLLLEATAGQGSNIGCTFEELNYIIQGLGEGFPIGVCLDTCHIFAAGYDIRTPQACKEMLDLFETQVGLSFLKAFHFNDSIFGLGSRKDRHAPLGEGAIGWDAFHYLMQSPKTRLLPKYLETPGGPPRWKEEIRLLRHQAKLEASTH